jgi:integrase
MFTDKQLKALIKSDGTNKGKQISESLGGRGSGALVFKVRSAAIGEFYFKYNDGNSRKLVKIGNYKTGNSKAGLTLAEARSKTQELSKIYRDQKDVKGVLSDQVRASQEARENWEKAQALGTFSQLVESYINQMREAGKVSASEVESSVERSVFKPYPQLRQKKARDVTIEDIKAVLARMIGHGVTTQTNRVRSYLMAIFNHGIKQENNPRVYLESPVRFHLQFNPVAAIPKQADFEQVGEIVISEGEIKALWDNIQNTERVGFVMSRYIRFMFAMAGQRLRQILQTSWDQYDLENRLVEINDSKGAGDQVRVHLVPLNDLAVAILNELKPITGGGIYPFAGGSHGSSKDQHIRADSIPKAFSRFGKTSGTNFRAADIRRTCKTLMARHGIRKELRDRIHNHSLNDIATKHYDRHDYLEEKRQVMSQWNDILGLILESKGNIVRMKLGS